MRKIWLAALVFGLLGTISLSADSGRVLLGEKVVAFHESESILPVGKYEGRFRSLALEVEKNDVEIFDVVVQYADGQVEKIPTRLVFDRNSRSRVIDLAGGRRMIREVRFSYKTVGRWKEGRARVQVYGLR